MTKSNLPMTFLWLDMLWGLLLLPLLVLLYVWLQRRRKKTTLRYANLGLVREALGKTIAWRRHLPPALLFLAIAALLLAAGRPAAVITLPSQQETIILAMDVSGSMRAADVKPNRLTAAQQAAKSFIAEQPKTTRIGVVSFAATASVVQSPTHSREDILAVALVEFGEHGLHGTSTDTIAQKAGVSQPYLFRLFGTKKALYLETIERCFDRIGREFAAAAGSAEPGDKLQAMARAYGPLLLDRTLLLGQMHSYADCSDPDVRALVSTRYGELWEWVQQTSGASAEEVREFFARGMLLNVIAAIDLRGLSDPWVADCIGDLGLG